MSEKTRVNYGNGLYGENNTIDFDKYLSDEMLPYTSALLKSDFEFYIQFFYRAIYKDYFRTCWFHKEIIKSLEEFVYGNPERKNLAISIPPRWGKLIADETPVLTKRGWITHAEIVVGDYVLSPSGKFVKVLAVSEKAPANCKVRFSDGDEIYCHENHEWIVYDRHLRKERTIETKEMLEKDFYRDRYLLPEISNEVVRQRRDFSAHKKEIFFESVERGDFGKIGNCIQVEGGVYCVGNRLKPTHNSILMIMWISWCFGIDPTCNFIYTCYEERITNKMSDDILNIIRHPFYQKLFGVQMNSNTEAKALWETKEKGTYRASPMGGAMTGFGAGKIGSKFGGGFIIDDPLNAKFFNSEVEKKRVEENYQAVIKKRLNNPAKTPIVLIMQRLAVDDLVGYIEANEADDWKIIRVPALNEDVNPPKSNWEWKSPTEVLLKEKKQSPYIFAAQMQQSPVVLGGELVKEEWFKFYNPLDTVRYKKVFFTADTAFKTNEWNDYTAVGLWAITEKNDLRLIDLLHKKIEAVDLLKEFFAFKNRWSGGVRGLPANVFYIEDKASGMELIQRMRREGGVSVIPVKDKGFDKMTKWNNSLFPYLEAGNVLLPNDKNDPRSKEIIAEMVLLCGDGSHKHDDICDMMTQAGEIAFGKKGMF